MKIALQELIDYCTAKDNAEICFPFGDVPICFKFNGRIFIEIYPNDSDYKITVRCEPDIGECYREQYKDIVLPGYHVPLRQRKYKNTLLLDKEIEKNVVLEMIDHSYNTLKQ
jgi:predicted DNA-binding protein (MmcQ/YjbR family)